MAELLIVVAIIAVLVAIAIPVFNSQLEKSRESTDLANVRAAYAQVMSAAITEDKQAQYEGNRIYNESTGVYSARVPLKQKKGDWESYPITIAEVTVTKAQPTNDRWTGCPVANGFCTVSYSATDGVVFNWSGGTPPSLEGAGAVMPVYNAILEKFKTNVLSMTSWDSLYTQTNHSAIKLLNEALQQTAAGRDVTSFSVVNTLVGRTENKITGGGTLTGDQFDQAERALVYLWTTDKRAEKTSLQNSDEKIPVMVARTNKDGVKEYAVIERPILRGDSNGYNALSSYMDGTTLKRPSNGTSYDISKLVGDVQFSTDYDAVMQIYQSKNPVTTK